MPGLLDPIRIRTLDLKNRIVVSPMCQYQAEDDGLVNDWHLVHYGSLSLGGAGLLITEATAIHPQGRITHRDLGIWNDEQIPGLTRLTQFAHQWGTKIGIQLGHAGRKADLRSPIVAPSEIPFSDHYQVPQALTATDMAHLVEAFAGAAGRAVSAGYDMVEIHGAHGYLLHQFLSPISNHRTDEYGGNRDGRARFPVQVARAVRAVVPDAMPVFIRLSASEYTDEGYTMEDMIYYAQQFKQAGIDVIDVSSGGNVPVAPPNVYAGYQVPFAEAIKQGAQVDVMSVGMLDNPELADAVIRSGRADLVAVARGFLYDKHWGHRAAIALHATPNVPKPYERAYR
jgi:NADPH2 dehydrogenase